MPLNIPSKLPAVEILKSENIFVMDSQRASAQDIRPLRIIILNLMPLKITTETDLIRLLSNTPLQLEIDFLKISGHVSKNTQVICVTHSAQIASNANEHFLIQKKFDDNKTFTSVTPLDFEGRKSELARIMGGLEITDTLLQSAEELLNQNLYGN